MKTIIEMAREAGLHRTQHNLMSNPVQQRFSYDGYEENLERFAALVRADERDRAMRENAYVLAEREACAKVAEIALLGADLDLARRVIKAIRARGNT